MGCQLSMSEANHILAKLSDQYTFYAPRLFIGTGCFSDTDVVRYGEITKIEDIVFDKKSDYSFKEILLPISQTIFYFTEDKVTEPEISQKTPVLFLRSCDIHALKRLDDVYLNNRFQDHYYQRLRENIKIVLMGCPQSFDSCFCVDMKTNQTDDYDFYLSVQDDQVFMNDHCQSGFFVNNHEDIDVDYVKETKVKVTLPGSLDTTKVKALDIFDEYNSRCIACGRCNFACPTCTCFTMQDIFYKDNGKVGERRRVWASCQVDGFTTIAGNISFRKTKGERMRYKLMHKIHDHHAKFGRHMCVGCGRCDDICPEYISFSHCINKLTQAMKEDNDHD